MQFNSTSEPWSDGSLGALLKSWYRVEQKDLISLIEAERWGRLSSNVFYFPFLFCFFFSFHLFVLPCFRVTRAEEIPYIHFDLHWSGCRLSWTVIIPLQHATTVNRLFPVIPCCSRSLLCTVWHRVRYICPILRSILLFRVAIVELHVFCLESGISLPVDPSLSDLLSMLLPR